ncbi:MAG TPA: enoyl-CoA hydratase-related protein [Streptosporangiaceae bacterium]|jgi:enoyl-CoA hydratase|nr:enoyl-CoA hydratase-related protein [Streptosporangiaceae bacterium]
MTGDSLATEAHGRVLVATLNRPAKSNALNQDLITALDEVADRVLADDAASWGALVLTGAGDRAFSAGADIGELDGIGGDAARRQMHRGQQVFGRLEALPVVVIAAINGVALGGGLELAMAADIRIAAPSARLGQPEITLANLPGWGGTQRLPRLVGRGVATELILAGDLVDAARARELGLVNQVCADPLGAAIELGGRIAARSPVAVRGAKAAIAAGLDRGMAAGLAAEADAVAACCETSTQRQAIRAFLGRHS